MKAEPVVDFVFTPHARIEMGRRGLDDEVVRAVLERPDQRWELRPGRHVVQSRVSLGDPAKPYVVRVFVDVDRAPRGCHGVPDQQDREVLEARVMRVSYDERTDTLSVVLKGEAQVVESDEDKPGVILDYDANGDLVSLEILDASRRVTDARRIEFETVNAIK